MQDPRRRELVLAIGTPCPYCGEAMGPDRPPTRDHIVPRRYGFTFADGNCAIVCDPCNNDKGGQTLRQWIRCLVRAGDRRAPVVASFRAAYKAQLRAPPAKSISIAVFPGVESI